jgi:hypothetical protein
MPDADTTRVALLYRQQATYAEAMPSNPPMKALRFTRDNFKYNKSTIVSNEIRADGMRSDMPQVGVDQQGGFSFELSGDTYDDFLAPALRGAWATNVLKNGTQNIVGFDFERQNLDITQFLLFRDMVVNNLNIVVTSQQAVTGDISFMGRRGARAGTSVRGTGTLTAVNANPIMSAGPGIQNVFVGGAPIGVGVREIRLAINNNLRARPVVDDIYSRAPGRGALDVTATINTYFGAGALYDAYIAHGSLALSFRISDNGGVGVGKAYDFLLPLCKIADDTIETPGLEQDVPENLTFRALYDPVTGAEIQITRVTL